MSNGLFIGDKDPVEIRVGSRKATSVYYSGDNVPQNPVLHISAKGLTTAGIAQSGGVVDLSGNGNNGTAYGGVEVVNDSEMGECFSFDGSNGYIRTDSNFNISRDMTLSLMVKLNAIRSSAILSIIKYVNNSYTGIDIYAYNSKIVFEDRPYKIEIMSGTIQTSQNYHIVVTSSVAEAKTKLFLDGVLIGTVNKAITAYTDFNKLTIGADSYNNNKVNGLISEVKIFPYALTSEQVQALYRGIKKVWSNVPEGAILHLNAKGLTTAGIAESGGVKDLSGNGNNGTAYGGVEVVNDSDLGECFSFDSSQNTEKIKIDNNIEFNENGLTIILNLKKTAFSSSGGYAMVLDLRTSNSGQIGYILIGSDKKMYFSASISNNMSYTIISANIQSKLANECLVVARVSNGKATLKIGNLEYEDNSAVFVPTENQKFSVTIGQSFNSSIVQPFNGLISEVKIFPYALTAHEVKKLYRASRR